MVLGWVKSKTSTTRFARHLKSFMRLKLLAAWWNFVHEQSCSNWHDMVGGMARARKAPEVSNAQASSSGDPVGILWGSNGDPIVFQGILAFCITARAT